MPWDASATAGFSAADPGDLWLPLGPRHTSVNVKVQLEDPKSMLALYRRLLGLRRGMPALNQGSYAPIDAVPDNVFAYLRAQGDERVLIVLNFGDEAACFVHKSVAGSQPLLSTSSRGAHVEGAELTLEPGEGVILRL